jgi:hypothetical protein
MYFARCGTRLGSPEKPANYEFDQPTPHGPTTGKSLISSQVGDHLMQT